MVQAEIETPQFDPAIKITSPNELIRAVVEDEHNLDVSSLTRNIEVPALHGKVGKTIERTLSIFDQVFVTQVGRVIYNTMHRSAVPETDGLDWDEAKANRYKNTFLLGEIEYYKSCGENDYYEKMIAERQMQLAYTEAFGFVDVDEITQDLRSAVGQAINMTDQEFINYYQKQREL